ncbi:AMP-binding protein [Chryseobacterium wanjuense]
MEHQTVNENVNYDFQIQQNQFKNVVSIFKEVSRSFPKKSAIIFENKSLSYEEMDRRSDELAFHLLSLQLKSGASVAVCMSQSVERIIAFLAVLKTGSAYIPVDGQLPENRIKMMMEDSGVELIITEDVYVSKFLEINVKLISMNHWQSKPAELETEIINPDNINPMQTAYIIYTSGSTGIPKGVEIHHEAFHTFVQSFTELWGFSAKDSDPPIQFNRI